MAADFINTAFVEEYKANVAMLMQQKMAKIAPFVSTDNYTGKAGTVVEQFGEATARVRTSRFQDTPNLEVEQKRPWVFPQDIDWGTMVDKIDTLRMIIDPTSPLAQAGVAGMNRKTDDIIITAFFATAKTGENGTTDEAFDTTNYQVGVDTGGTASSLNVAKLQEAVRMHIAANKEELDEPLYAAIGSYEHDALLKEIEVVSRDFNGGQPVLVDGIIKRFMGINFIITERLNITSGNRLIPVWRPSGMHLGTWDGLTARVTERADKSYAWQVYNSMTRGSTRVEQGKVVQVLCDDQI